MQSDLPHFPPTCISLFCSTSLLSAKQRQGSLFLLMSGRTKTRDKTLFFCGSITFYVRNTSKHVSFLLPWQHLHCHIYLFYLYMFICRALLECMCSALICNWARLSAQLWWHFGFNLTFLLSKTATPSKHTESWYIYLSSYFRPSPHIHTKNTHKLV